jgi:predicted transcriptional regulator
VTATTRNPLTDEAYDVRTVIKETVNSARFVVLRAIGELPESATQTDVATHANISRQAVSPHLPVLHDQGLVNHHDGRIKLTTGGMLFVDVIERCLQTVSLTELSFLTRSSYPISLLQELEKRPYRLSELPRVVRNLPSQSTIRRILTGFVDYGWVVDVGGQHRITAAGSNTLSAYNELATITEQFIEKAPWLQRLPIEAATFPPEELANADLIVSNPRSPAAVLSTCLKLYDRNISQFRCLCSVFNPVLFHAYRGLLELGVESEAILDWPTALKAADDIGTKYAVQNDRYSNYQCFVLADSHTLGIGLYDDRKVAVAAYNEAGSGKHIAMIISSNNRLVDWGKELYEIYRSKAQPASEILSH